jgi:hypothetical protein
MMEPNHLVLKAEFVEPFTNCQWPLVGIGVPFEFFYLFFIYFYSKAKFYNLFLI